MGKMKTAEKLPPIEQLRGRPLGRILMKMGVLSRDKVHECLNIQDQKVMLLARSEIFVELGLVDETQLQVALAAKRGMEYVSIDGVDIPQDVVEKVPTQMAKSYHIVPIEYDKEKNELGILLVSADDSGNPNVTTVSIAGFGMDNFGPTTSVFVPSPPWSSHPTAGLPRWPRRAGMVR